VRVRVRVCTRKEHTAYNTYEHSHIRTQSRGASTHDKKYTQERARAHVARVIVVNARYTGTGLRIATVPAVKQKKHAPAKKKIQTKDYTTVACSFFLSGIYINVNCISEPKKKNITTLYNALFVSPVFFFKDLFN